MPLILESSSYFDHSSEHIPTNITSKSSSSDAMSLMSSIRSKLKLNSKSTKKHTSSWTSERSSSMAFSKDSAAITPIPTTTTFSAPPTRRPAAHDASLDLPPPYTGPTRTPNVSTSQTNSAEDDPYSFLKIFDTVFLIDDSGSMAGSKWAETAAALAAVVPICAARDQDGVDIHFLNHPDSSEYKNLKRAEDVMSIFRSVRPSGGTPTGIRLHHLLKKYLAEAAKWEGAMEEKVKPMNIIVITDGAAGDDPYTVIANAAKKLGALNAPAWQVGIQFFQIGTDPEATEMLRELDDLLASQENTRDIVDTVPWKGENGQGLNADGIMKVVLGAVNRRWDRKKL